MITLAALPLCMRIILNGKETDVPDGLSVRALVEHVGLGKSATAAELNMELIPRREQEARNLREGDRVELVTLVGGG